MGSGVGLVEVGVLELGELIGIRRVGVGGELGSKELE